jgi:hypothetical protein
MVFFTDNRQLTTHNSQLEYVIRRNDPYLIAWCVVIIVGTA